MPSTARPGSRGTALGVDEAGRGPVLGPLVVAGVRARQEDLAALGVADSKTLAPERRRELATAVGDVAEAVALRVVPARELDRRMATETLNEVEVAFFAEVLQDLGAPDGARCFLDACDTDAARFGHRVLAALGPPWREVPMTSEHGADGRHPVVSAASIVAKVERDAAMARIARELQDLDGHGGPVGSGYPSDPSTRAFLEAWVAEHGDLPPHTRTRWATARRLVPRDRTLADFGATLESPPEASR